MQPKIALSGKMRSGKTTLARIFADEFQIPLDSFASPLKDLLRPVGLHQHRQVLQQVGSAITAADDYAFVRLLSQRYPALHVTGLVIDDLRREVEYEWARNSGFILIRLEVARQTQLQRSAEPQALEHPTELLDPDDYAWDLTVNTDWTTPEEIAAFCIPIIRSTVAHSVFRPRAVRDLEAGQGQKPEADLRQELQPAQELASDAL